MQNCILFNPVHQEESEQSEERNHRLEWDEEADEDKIADYVDVLTAEFVLWLLCDIVQLVLWQNDFVY